MKTRLVTLATLIVTLVAVAASFTATASAAFPVDAKLECDVDQFMINPGYSIEKYALMYFRVDGGQWQTSPWYYVKPPFSQYMFDNSSRTWLSIPWGATAFTTYDAPGVHEIEAWEYRYYLNGATQWIPLGSCTTNSIQGGGFEFTYVRP